MRIATALLVLLCGCRAAVPGGPEATCVRACESRLEGRCSEAECRRGCNAVIDRLVEKEGDTVLGCMAKAAPGCGDLLWADCGARVGPHVDGGPPAPLPPSDD